MAFEQRRAAGPGGLTRRAVLCLLVLALLPATVSAQGRRARLSRDLAARVQAGTTEATCVILPGSQTQVDRVAARHGLRVHKRLASGAVVEVPAVTPGAFRITLKVLEGASGNYQSDVVEATC